MFSGLGTAISDRSLLHGTHGRDCYCSVKIPSTFFFNNRTTEI